MRASATASRSPADQVGSFREILTKEPVGVLVRRPLPRGVRIGEEDSPPGVERELGVAGEFLPTVPGEGLAQLDRQLRHRCGQGPVHGDGAVATEGRSVLHAWRLTPTLEAGQMDQDGRPTAAFDDGADSGSAGPDDQISFPVPGNGTVGGFCGSLADHHLCGDVALRLVLGPFSWRPQGPARAQAGHQFPLQSAAALDVERLVDRLVTDAHVYIFREVDLEPVADLLSAPRRRPPPVLAVGLVQPLPRGCFGPVTIVPSARRTCPASRSCP